MSSFVPHECIILIFHRSLPLWSGQSFLQIRRLTRGRHEGVVHSTIGMLLRFSDPILQTGSGWHGLDDLVGAPTTVDKAAEGAQVWA
jgi:hypothetical protein